MITIVAFMCHMLEAISQPVCHEEIVTRLEMSMASCGTMSQPIIAAWKEQSIYRSDQWRIMRYKCEDGDYQTKDSI